MSNEADMQVPLTSHTVADLCPWATHLMALLGEPVNDEFLSAFAQRYGDAWLARLTNRTQAIRTFRQTKDTVAQRKYWELYELLLLEHWLSSEPRPIARTLGPNQNFDKTLVSLRGNVGLALYSRARSVNWQEPLTFSRALRVAEQYFRSVLEHEHLMRQRKLREFEGRLGVCLVLQARYSDLGIGAASEMVERLRSSIARGNQQIDAYVYLAEALLRLHDATGEPDCLNELVRIPESCTMCATSEVLVSHVAEAWFRLSQLTSRPEVIALCQQRAIAACDRIAGSRDPIVHARTSIVRAFCDLAARGWGRSGPLAMRGLRTPFGVQTSVRAWRQSNRSGATRLLRELDRRLGSAPRTIRQTPIHRRLAASVKSELALLLDGSGETSEKFRHLSAAVALREDTHGRALNDPESRLENALDRFALFQATKQGSYLVAAVRDTLALIEFDQAWPTPLLVLARELEHLSDPIPMPVAYELRRLPANLSQRVLAHVLATDIPAIYALAASRALASREVDRKHLGGRSGVYLAEDYSGIVSETFVFKPTTAALAEREARRVTRLDEAIKRMGLNTKFSVPATLATSELPADDVLRKQGNEVLVARQFHYGTILPDALAGSELAVRTFILESVVAYLAAIHVAEMYEGCPGQGMRRELLRKDFGRWLRSGLQLDDYLDVFDEWWEFFDQRLPPLPRRDAHPLNWLITPERGVVAVDFEACGWRPAGYELAQLLDDHPLLPVSESGWKTRLFLLRQYRRELQRHGLRIDHNLLVRSWEASTIARSIGLLTSPRSDAKMRAHGEAILQWIGEHSRSPRIRNLAMKLNTAWTIRRGAIASSEDASSPISESRRRHLSRAMAYELRHGATVLLDPGGWAYIASVSDALNRVGLNTSKAEVRAVAQAFDEPRFEVDGNRVRARYGHTRDVTIAYEQVRPTFTLYHGTASRNLDAIFSRGEGLQTMGRQWVHLSSDPTQALRTAERHGPGVLLALEPNGEVEVFHAGGNVYLAADVPAKKLRIVSPSELFLSAVPSAPSLGRT